jgi:EAL domain-containing protein (putative c-di-GMP-specific phosphodiesterase class I)
MFATPSVDAGRMGILAGRRLRLLVAVALINGLVCVVAPAIVLSRGSAQAPIGGFVLWMAAVAVTLTPLQAWALWMVIGTPIRGLVRTRRLKRAVGDVIDNRRLTIAFQPIVNLETRKVVGAEALSRFSVNPSITPDVWFSRAEEVGRGLDLELLAVQMALQAAVAIPGDPYIGVNVSPATLAHPRLLEVLLDAPIPATRITVEVTEHTQVDDYKLLQAPREQLRAHGILLAVDDAGSGYASLQRIVALVPDFIKLDRSLLTGIEHDNARRALVAAVVMFSLESGASVCGEGVETLDEFEALCELGVDAAQGFLLGRPSTSPEDWQRWPGTMPVRTHTSIRHGVYVIPGTK